MVHEHNKLCDICGCSMRGIFKLLFELMECFGKFKKRDSKIKQQWVIFIYVLLFYKITMEKIKQ